ncbi:MAG: sigma-70 family RNA polymerase sigma factor [Actinomycetota bacterium]|nr:sigma-70 family RNA polymerase sigma factor [Actinomycetota bacterium]
MLQPSQTNQLNQLNRANHRTLCLEHRGDLEDRRVVTTLVTAAAMGDNRATEALIERFSGLVWSIAWSYHLSGADAADVSQVVWLRLVENIRRIRQPGSVGAWLASVTRHECLRLLRRAEREVTTSDELDLDDRSSEDDIDLGLLSDERDAALRRAFEGLPPRWRSLLEVLMDAPLASYEEVAETVGMPIGSIGPTRQRCLERLRSAQVLVELTAA